MRRTILVGTLLCACSIGGWAQSAKPASFEVTLIKPAKPEETGRDWDSDRNTTTIGNFALLDLIMRAYNLKSATQVVDAPEWAEKDRYDIVAKSSEEEFERLGKLKQDESSEEYRSMLQSMLADRFGLRVEKSSQRMPRFTLERVSDTALGPGLKVTPATPDGRPEGGRNTSSHGNGTTVTMDVSGASMEDIAKILSGRGEVGRRVVVDKTGVPGFFNFKFEFAPDSGMGVSPNATLPGLLDVVRQQLGLKLVKDEGDVPVVIVKEAKKPELD